MHHIFRGRVEVFRGGETLRVNSRTDLGIQGNLIEPGHSSRAAPDPSEHFLRADRVSLHDSQGLLSFTRQGLKGLGRAFRDLVGQAQHVLGSHCGIRVGGKGGGPQLGHLSIEKAPETSSLGCLRPAQSFFNGQVGLSTHEASGKKETEWGPGAS